jgi:hypothetical protein
MTQKEIQDERNRVSTEIFNKLYSSVLKPMGILSYQLQRLIYLDQELGKLVKEMEEECQRQKEKERAPSPQIVPDMKSSPQSASETP